MKGNILTTNDEQLSLDYGEIKSVKPSISKTLAARQQLPEITENAKETIREQNELLKEQQKSIKAIIDQYEKLNDEQKKIVKRSPEFKALQKNFKDNADAIERSNYLLDNQNAKAKDAIELMELQNTLTVDNQTNLELIGMTYTDNLKTMKKLTQEQKEQLGYIRQSGEELKSSYSDSLKEIKGTIKDANQSVSEMFKDNLKNASSKLQNWANTLNIQKLTKLAERSSLSQLQEQLTRAYGLTNKEFNRLKNDISDTYNSALYTAEEKINTYKSLQEVGIGDQDDTKKYFTTLLNGQSLMNMSTETQKKLLATGNRLNRDQLTFTTNSVAKWMKTATNLSTQQLDQLVQMNANFTNDMADLGVDSQEFQATDAATGVALTNYFKDDGKTYSLLQEAMKTATSTEQAAAMYGKTSGDMKNEYNSGKDYFTILENSSGYAKDFLNKLRSDYDNATYYMDEYVNQAGILDSATASIIKKYVDAERQGVDLKSKINEQQVNPYDSSAVEELKKNRDESLSTTEKLANTMSEWYVNADWKVINDVDKTLLGIAAVLDVISAAVTTGQFLSKIFGKGSGGNVGTATKGLKLFGGTNAAGQSGGIFTNLFGKGSTLGGSIGFGGGTSKSGLSKQLLGNGALSKAVGYGALLKMGTNFFGGMSTTANELYGLKKNENGEIVSDNPNLGQRVLTGAATMFSGTKVNNQQNAYDGISGSIMKSMGMKKDTAASVKNIGGGALKGAALGAAAGSVIPVIGTAAGAIIGGVGGFLGGLFKDSKRKKQEQLQEEQLKQQKEIAENTAATVNTMRRQNTFSQRHIQSYRPTGAVYNTTSNISHGSSTTNQIQQMLGKWNISRGFEESETIKDGKPTGEYSFHKGLDLYANGIQKVHAAQSGIARIIKNKDIGNHGVLIEGDDGQTYVYGHMRSHFIEDGDYVDVAQHIGDMGNEGNSTDQHLHYQVSDSQGIWDDPLKNGAPNSIWSGISESNERSIKDIISQTFTTNNNQIERDNSDITKGLSEIKQTLIDLSNRQTQEEHLLSILQGSKRHEPKMN